jgi:ligand-binding SRPBCC domain-containing protein
MKIRTLQTSIWLPKPPEAVFPFFADIGNLDRITPPWLHFHILTPRGPIEKGSVIEYRLRWRGVPIAWRTEITAWTPPNRFVDTQIQGPYRQWIHEHTFEPRSNGTLAADRVDYAIPGWIAEPLLYHLVVGRDVRRIFDYRREVMGQIYSPREKTGPGL